MANDAQYKDAIDRVRKGEGNSWDRELAERAAKSHGFNLQRDAKEALGW